MLTSHDIRRALQRLEAVYHPPTGDPADVAAVWLDVLRDRSPEELQSAITAIIRSEARYHPKPGQVLGDIQRASGDGAMKRLHGLEEQYMAWRQGNCYGPCPVCGSEMETKVRGGPRCDRQRHWEQDLPIIGKIA